MIVLDKESKVPIYKQIYAQVKEQIQEGYIKEGERLYSTRTLASILGVGRNTVEKAYYMLQDEGFTTPTQGSGYIVNKLPDIYSKGLTSFVYPTPQRHNVKYDMINNFSEALLGDNDWRSCFMNTMDVLQSREIMDFSQRQGEEVLLELVASTLHLYRGVKCEPYQIILTSGQYYSAELIAGLFYPERYSVLLENPSSNVYRTVFGRSRFNISYIPVEEDGIATDELYKYTNSLLFISPTHQFPTGSELSAEKRKQILEWASQSGSYIIEDDYDSKLCYKSAPQASIQAYDENDRVIHTGAFTYMLTPGMRIGYVVLPKNLYNIYDSAYKGYINSVPLICQYAFVEYLSEGHMLRHIRRFLKQNKDKYDALIKELKNAFGDKITIYGGGYGLFFNARIHNGMTESELIYSAQQKGVRVYSLSEYYRPPLVYNDISVRIGFGSILLKDIPKIVALLKEAWEG